MQLTWASPVETTLPWLISVSLASGETLVLLTCLRACARERRGNDCESRWLNHISIFHEKWVRLYFSNTNAIAAIVNVARIVASVRISLCQRGVEKKEGDSSLAILCGDLTDHV
jgi:hypothetical protein